MSEDNTTTNQSVIQIHYSNESIQDANCIVTHTTESDSSLSEVKMGSWFRLRTRLIEFYGNISNIYMSQFMFSECKALTRVNLSGTEPVDNGTFKGTLNNVVVLQHTFRGVKGVKKQHIKFPNITFANSNFYNTGVEEVQSNYKKVVRMVGEYEHCSNLKKVNFEGGLNYLVQGSATFRNCYNLTSFEYDLPRLLMGVGMFEGCKLDKASVERILYSLPNINNLKNSKANANVNTNGIWGTINGAAVEQEKIIMTDPKEDGYISPTDTNQVIARIYNNKSSDWVAVYSRRVRRKPNFKENTQEIEFYWEGLSIPNSEVGVLDIGMGQGVKEQVTDAINHAIGKGWKINIS